jgi:hypothetical protein
LSPEHAWYLYGIAKHGDAESGLAQATVGVDGSALVSIIVHDELAALVSAVPLAEFAAERVRSLAQDDAWLGRIVREHERVVDALQKSFTIVPARLFSVYASDDDIRASLAESQASILRTLAVLAGCDEFEIRLTFDRAALGERLKRTVPEIAKLVETRAAASVGRAYLVERQIASLLKRTIESTIEDVGEQAFAELRSRAVAERDLSPKRVTEGDTTLAVLRRAFLVRRAQRAEFLDAVERVGVLHEEIRVEYGGPWPPYNFVDPDVLEEQGSVHG